jgi:hypothetical protein
MAVNGQAVQVTFVERVEEIGDTVWQECFPLSLEGRFWYHTLETCGLEDQFGFHYALLSAGGRPVGIAPCFLHDVPISLVAPLAAALVLQGLAKIFPRVGYQRTFFVGSPCADEGTIGLVPGVGLAEVIGELRGAVLARARELQAPMVVFKDFAEADLPVLTGETGFCPTLSYPGAVVRLPPSGKEAYYRSLAHKQRHNLFKKLRQSRALIALETTMVERPSDRVLAEIFDLFKQTYEKGRTKFERLGLRFFAEIREQPTARFILQREQKSGALVAFMLVFVLGDRMINKFIGLDYRRAGRSYLYFRLFDAALDFAYASGARELQSGQTGYSAKLDLGHRLVPLFNVFRHENPLVHAVFRAVGRRVTWRSLDGDLAVWLRAHPEGDWKPRD